MISKSIKGDFVIKLFSKYFLYGYISFLGFILFSAFSINLIKSYLFPVNMAALFFVLCSILCLMQFFRILFSTKHKFRYYKISLYRLKTRGYRDSYFECEMHEPCFRLIIKDLLKDNGYLPEYYKLCEKCRGKNLRIERAKEKLLAKVMKQKGEY